MRLQHACNTRKCTARRRHLRSLLLLRSRDLPSRAMSHSVIYMQDSLFR